MVINGERIKASSYTCYGKTYKNLTGVIDKVYENSVMMSDVEGIPDEILMSLNYHIVVSKRLIPVYKTEVKERDEESLLKDKRYVENNRYLSELEMYKDEMKSYVKRGYTIEELTDIYNGKLSRQRINRILKRYRLETLPELKFKVTNCSTYKVTYYRSKTLASKVLNENSLRLIKEVNHPLPVKVKGEDCIIEFGNWSPHNIKVSDSVKINYNKTL